jgi:RND family efflux transporter MFP subunit
MKNFFLKIKNFIIAHKIISGLVIIILIFVGYSFYQKTTAGTVKVSYLTQAASLQTITVSVTGSGQVSELNSVDIKPQISGNSQALTAMNIKKGDQVKAGQVLATIDQSSVLAALSQARSTLTNAEANYQTLVAGAQAVDINISKNSVTQAQNSYNNALLNQQNTIKTTATNVTQAQNAYNDLTDTTSSANPTNKRGVAITTIDNQLTQDRNALDAENKVLTDNIFKAVFGALNSSLVDSAKVSYSQAISLLSTAQNTLSNTKVSRTDANIDQAVNDAVAAMNGAQVSLNYCYSALQNSIAGSGAGTTQSSIDSYKSSINSQLSAVNSGITSIQNSVQAFKDAVTAAQNALQTAQLSEQTQLAQAKASVDSSYNSWQTSKDQLAKLTAPPTVQSVNTALASIASAKTQVQQATTNLNNTIITAPFDGLIAAANPHQGDQVSPTTVIATLITNQFVVNIPLNEVDVARVKVGEPAMLTFDALPDLTVAGKVVDIDTIGTVSQGVVTYNVKISLDTQDVGVKPGMSTNASIITQVAADVLSVPNAAIKIQGTSNYVQELDAKGAPQNVPVTIGIANDTYTQIISGIKEGDNVVTQTITSTVSKSTTGTAGIGSLLGGNRAGGISGAAAGAAFRATGGGGRPGN